MKIGIIGSGKFGTALSLVAGQKNKTTVFTRYEEEVKEINTYHTHKKLFPQIELPRRITAVKGFENGLSEQDILFLAVPFQALGEVFSKIKPHINYNMSIISCAKGLDIETGKTGSQLFEQFFGSKKQYGTLSGPNFANEIVKKDITATIVASRNIKVAKKCITALETSFFQVQYSDDLIGVEICGALKNIIAMAAGIHKSLDLGDNSKALLFTRGMQEISKLVHKLGGLDKTILSISGLGDMILTASSFNSRNYQLGVWLGEGYTLDEALHKINSTVESIHTVKSAYYLMQEFQLDMPIVQTLYRLINGEKISKAKLIYDLLMRPIVNHEENSRNQKLFEI